MKRKASKPPSLRRVLNDAYKRAQGDYPTLLGPFECIPRIYRQEPDKLVSDFCEGWHRQLWSTEDDDYVQHNERAEGNISGHTCIVTRGDEHGVAVFLMKDPDERPQLQSAALFATFAHELGHVDDIVRGVNFGDDSVDMTAVEEYAHHFACRHIMATAALADVYATALPPSELREWRTAFSSFLRPIMAFYIDEMLPNLAAVPVRSISTAAERVMASDEFREYRRFATG